MAWINFYIVIALLLFGCAKSVTRHKFPSTEIISAHKRIQLSLDHGKGDSLQILYLGCGHMIIRYRGDCIATDPFFSTQSFTKRKINVSLPALEKYKAILKYHAVDLTKTRSIWIGHTHYDHMMDIPVLLKNKLLPEDVILFGNNYGNSILTNFIGEGQYHSISSFEVYDPVGPKLIPQWLKAAPSIRVMPIRSEHAPHLKIGPIKIHLMKGNFRPEYFKNTYREATSVTKRKNWKEGDVYSYLMDFMKEDKIQFRVFIQTSASDFPKGSPPPEILKDHPVDIAVLCAASANNTRLYPVGILKDLQPKKVVFIHWEDFFLKPLDFESTKLLRLTNFRKLNERLTKAGFKPTKENYAMPRPGTMMTIN
jgi:hypothetical protein